MTWSSSFGPGGPPIRRTEPNANYDGSNKRVAGHYHKLRNQRTSSLGEGSPMQPNHPSKSQAEKIKTGPIGRLPPPSSVRQNATSTSRTQGSEAGHEGSLLPWNPQAEEPKLRPSGVAPYSPLARLVAHSEYWENLLGLGSRCAQPFFATSTTCCPLDAAGWGF